MQLIHLYGDALASPEGMPLAHCVSRNGAVSAGFALQVHRRYAIRRELQATPNRSCPGLVVQYRGERLILNLITKEHHTDKPTIQSFASALEILKNFLLYNNIREFCTVELGTGLDRLKYCEVLQALCGVFHNTNIKIYMYHF